DDDDIDRPPARNAFVLPMDVPLTALLGRQHMCAQAHAESFGKDELCRLVYPLLLQSIDLLQKLRTGLRRDRIVATRANRLRLRLDGLQPVERQEPAPKVLELFDPSHRQAPLARQPGFFS